MSEIRCPNCGKVNPSFADNCLGCQKPLPPPGQPEPPTPGMEEEIPEWLQRIRERTEKENPPQEEYVPPFNTGDIPEWLKELKEEKIDKETPSAGADESQEEDDWLERLRTSPVYQKDDAQKPLQPDESEEMPAISPDIWGPEIEGSMPDWLKAATSPQAKPFNDFVFPKPEETHPDDITAPIPLKEEKPYPFTQGTDETPLQRVNEGADYLAAMDAGQEPLPFLQPTAEDQPGSDGRLMTSDFFQPTALTNRIQLSEKQRLNVGLLKTILSNEGEPKPVTPAAAGGGKPFGRLAFIIVMLLVLVGLMVIAPAPSALPQLYPVEVAALFNELSILPQDSPVLVAVDYDPALAGEMQLSSGSMLGHLMARGARIAIISTRPAGPMLAESLMGYVLPGQPQFPAGDHIVNLGYIPGDAAGLRTFARQPRETTPYTAGLKLAWDSPVLQGINLLSDFSAVIVITDNAEVMRNWVEQVQPSLGLSPLYVVVSAQAGPLIQPYFESNQIQGGLSGLLGGAMYSQILGRPGFADSFMNAFQAGVLIAAAAVIAGGLKNLFSFLFAEKTPGEDE